MTFIISAISALGSLIAATATNGCLFVFLDEPEIPKSLMEK